MRCDEGYLCDVCGREVIGLVVSDLYLRFVLGEVPLEELHQEPERHIRCHPELAQFITDPAFDPVRVDGPFAKSNLDPGYVADAEARVTRAWRRLQWLPTSGLMLPEYPLPREFED